MKEKTYEGTKKTQNGLKRMFFSALAILLQAVFMVYMLTRLNEYAAAINTTTSVRKTLQKNAEFRPPQ